MSLELEETKETELTLQKNHCVWWMEEAREEKRPDEILSQLVRQIEDDQEPRYAAYKEFQRLFTDNTNGFGDDPLGGLLSGELSQNELANTIETLWAQVFKSAIVPAVAVSEADYEEWSRAKAYGRWIDGVLEESKAYARAFPQAGIHSLVFGTGCIKVFSEADPDDDDVSHVRCEAVSPRYLFVDKLEAKTGNPRQLFQKSHIDRWSVLAQFQDQEHGSYGKKAERRAGILSCNSNDDDDLGYSNVMRCDMLTVWEAWHLPSKPGGKDGRHVIWIKGCTLVDEPWEWPTFPFVFIRFGARVDGFWGDSAVRRIAPTQRLLDKLNTKIDESQDVMGVPRILVRNGANIRKSAIDDIPGGVLECDDIAGIRDWNAQCVTPELYQDRDNAPRKMRSLLGVSDFEVQQQIPQGMRDVSGAFLERWVDQGQARHAMFHKEYEQASVELAYLYMRMAEDLQEAGKDVVVMAPGDDTKTSVETLKFSEVVIDRKRMKLVVQPMSQLPQTFSGKIEAITKMTQDAKLPLDPKTAMRMLQVPDLNSTMDMLVSDEEVIQRNLHWMVKNGEGLSPLPWDNLDLIVQMTTRFINSYRLRKDASMEKVAILAKYIDDALQLKGGLDAPDPNAPPPDVPPGMPPGMPPPGDPGMPPMDPTGAPPGPMPPPPGPPGVPPPGPGPVGPPMM